MGLAVVERIGLEVEVARKVVGEGFGGCMDSCCMGGVIGGCSWGCWKSGGCANPGGGWCRWCVELVGGRVWRRSCLVVGNGGVSG